MRLLDIVTSHIAAGRDRKHPEQRKGKS